MTNPYSDLPLLAEPDGFRIEVDADSERGDIVLECPPMNVISMGQRDQLRAAFEALTYPVTDAIVAEGGYEDVLKTMQGM